MDTTTNNEFYKKAALNAASLMKGLGLAGAIPNDALKSYLAIAAALGALGGAGAGVVSSYVKAKNPEALSLDRQKKFYDRKISEMENENWLNDLISAKKKLENSKMSPEDRKALEKKYIDLINK